VKKLIVLWASILIVTLNLRSEEKFFLSGYFKNFSIVFLFPEHESVYGLSSPAIGATNNRLRMKFAMKPLSWLAFDAAYDLSPRIQDPSLFREDLFFAKIETNRYRVADFRPRIYPESDEQTRSFGLYHNLDRFSATVKTKFADIFVGRQAVAWGSARIINPTDIIAPFTFNELDPEERRGVDAVRVRIPLGVMDELDFGYVAGKDFDFDKSAFFLRGKTYVARTDLSLLLLGFYDHLLIGMDIARSIRGAGFWAEAAYVIPDFFKEGTDGSNYFRLSTGLDYNLTAKMYGFAEYHFSSAGKRKAEDYMDFFQSSAFQDGSVYLMAKHYLGVGLTYQVTPLIPFSGLVLLNINDGSFTLAPHMEYNIAENIYLSMGCYLGFGKKPERILVPPNPPEILFHSEFGAYPDMIFTSFRVYF
jgi:hypothetical protein